MTTKRGRGPHGAHTEAQRAKIIANIAKRLEVGDSMNAICAQKGMPCRETLRLWCQADPEIDAAIMSAREIGFELRAEQAVKDAKNAEDAQRGRLAFDAERWYLGKLSKAFSDKVRHVGGDKDDPAIRTVTRIERTILDPKDM